MLSTTAKNWIFAFFVATTALTTLWLSILLLHEHRMSQRSGYDIAHNGQSDAGKFPFLTDAQLLNIGWAHTEEEFAAGVGITVPPTSYIHNEKRLSKAKKSIGIFGCSFTEGFETATGNDFPSLMQDELIRKGIDSVAIVNYGVSSYGFAQANLLFEYVAKARNHDYVVLNLYHFHMLRDVLFSFSNAYFPIHARYILENGAPRLISPIGKNRRDAAQQYNRLFQDRRYLDYDRKSPNFLSLAGTDYNPFYYTGDPSDDGAKKEMSTIYAALIAQIAAHCRGVLVLAHDEFLLEIENQVKPKNVWFQAFQPEKYFERNRSLYTASFKHYSALGNQFIAQKLLRLMSSKFEEKQLFVKAEISSLSTENELQVNSVLGDCNNLTFGYSNITGIEAYRWEEGLPFESYDHKLNNNQSLPAHLLFTDNDLSDICFIGLMQKPKPDSQIELVLKDETNQVIGQIQAVSANSSRIVPTERLQFDDLLIVRDTLSSNLIKSWYVLSSEGISDVSMRINGQEIGRSTEAFSVDDALPPEQFNGIFKPWIENAIRGTHLNIESVKIQSFNEAIEDCYYVRSNSNVEFIEADSTLQSGDVFFQYFDGTELKRENIGLWKYDTILQPNRFDWF